MSSNQLRMPFAEWLFRMSEAGLAPQARELAVYAVAFKVSSNEELAKLAGMDTIVSGKSIADKTYNRWKKLLTDDGWVILKAVTVGRVTTIEVFPAFGSEPVTFTDLKAREARRFYESRSYGSEVEATDETDASAVEVTDETRNSYAPAVEPTGGSRAPTRGVVNNNIYNKTNNLPSLTAVELDAAREGETGIGNGVFVNCETVRHANFEISLKAIQLQLCGTVDMDTIKSVAAGHALQWATDIASGKSPAKVVPSNTASFIRASIQNQANNAAVTDVRKSRAAGNGASKRMSLKELNDGVDAAYDRNFFGQTKGITHER
jgi:hypothetical protein